MANYRHFGEIPHFPEGSIFDNRKQLSDSGIHPPTQAGISGSKYEGADSIVLNGGYIDDVDNWDTVIYTGHGGRDANGRQVRDQYLIDSGNAALVISYNLALPVRVSRGPKGNLQWSPLSGYRYDGIYYVKSYWLEKGLDGYNVCRYELIKKQ